MKRPRLIAVVSFGLLAACCLAGPSAGARAAEGEPANDSQLAKLYVRLLGSSQ